jgi:hypothetical protein
VFKGISAEGNKKMRKEEREKKPSEEMKLKRKSKKKKEAQRYLRHKWHVYGRE